LGHIPTDSEIADYETEYKKQRREREQQNGAAAQPIPAPLHAGYDDADQDSSGDDPTLATVCWIEVGKNTLMGKELEFKAEQALFFGLSPIGDKKEERTFAFTVSSGDSVPLRFVYQGNSMWRLQMNVDVPEVAVGLRPRDPITGKQGRSPFVAVVTRTDKSNHFALGFIDEQSPDYTEVRNRSENFGTLGSTSARKYGWY